MESEELSTKFEVENIVGSAEFRMKMSFYLDEVQKKPVMIHRGNPEKTVVIISKDLFLKLIDNATKK